jgi:NAD(P)H-dependent FMN reductase
MRILGIPGSLRQGSHNRALLVAASELAPPSATVEVVGLQGIPLYDGDLEAAQGLPPAVAALKDRIAASDALLLATPEYNSSLPGVLKNAMDWLSRPASDIPRVFGNRPLGLIGATPGPRATQLAQAAWLPVFRALGLRLWTGGQLNVSGAGKVFDASGALIDPDLRERLAKYLAGFAAFVERG